MMRIDSLVQRGRMPRALVLAAIVGSAACNEADGTDPWPGAYPPEAEIDRPKGGMDAGRDASSADGAAADTDAELDAGADDAGPDATANGDAGSDAAAQRDGSPSA